jgi:hypothetical protein
MRSWNRMTPVLLLLWVSGPVAGATQLGKYLCITDYAAGIFFRPDGTLAAGQITVAPEKQKFFVTISVEPLRDSEGRRQACFTKQQGEALKYEPPPATGEEFDKTIDRLLDPKREKAEEEKREADPSYISPLVLSPEQFISACLSNFTADVREHHVLRSFDGNSFSDYTGLRGDAMVFQLFGPNSALAFRLYEQPPSGVAPDSNDIVYRGRCELIQATTP